MIQSHIKPMPRLIDGQMLMKTGAVGAMMDISDGIASDLLHILNASGVGAEVHLDMIPISDELKSVCRRYSLDSCRLALGGGEDYELLFTAPADIEDQLDFPIFKIGEIVPGNSLVWMKDGRSVDYDINGYNHF